MSGNYAAVPVDTQEEKENFSNVENMDIVPENSFSPESELESGSSSHNTPLKPVDSSSHTPGLLVTGPLSIGIALNYIRKRPLHVLLLLIVITLCDLLFFYFRFTTPSLHSVEVFLDPAHADAKVSVSGSAKLSSATVSVDLKQVSCSYLYRADVSHSFSSVGDIIMDVSTGNNGAVGDGINADISLHNTKYSTLRKVVHDFSTRAEVTGQLELNCNIAFGVTWYSMISIPTHFPISQTLDIQSMKSRRVSNKDDESSSLQPRVAIEPQSDSSMHALHFLLDLKLHSMRKKLGVDSFVVHVPKLVYASTLVDRGTFKKSFLRVRTKALTLDLAQQHPMAQVDVKLSCTPAVSGPEQLLQQNVSGSGSCTLLSPVDFGLFNTELQQNKFVNISAYSLADNFISSFLGEYHFIQSVDDSLYPGNVMSDDDSAISSTSRALTVGTPSTLSSSNSVSSGASCVTVNSDGVYITQTCMVVEAGFFKIYLGMYSTEGGFTGHARSVTSWSPNGEVFDSMLEAQMSSDGTDYGVFGEISFSIPDQNMTVVVAANQSSSSNGVASSELLFLESLDVQWDFSNAASNGQLFANSYSIVSGVPNPIQAELLFHYGDHSYILDVLVSDTAAQNNLGQTFKAYAIGAYTGSWSRWYWTLTEGLLSYESHQIGSAQAVLGYDVPGDSGSIFTTFSVIDGQTNNTVVASNITAVNWKSQEGWLSDGQISAISLFELMSGLQPLISWDTMGIFQYGNESFLVSVVENPLLNSAGFSEAPKNMLGKVPMKPMQLLQLETHDLYSSDGFWQKWTPEFIMKELVESLHITHVDVISSFESVFDRARFGISGGNGNVYPQRKLQVMQPYQFLLTGFGTYGGGWNEWHAVLNGSVLILEHEVQGFAVGDMSYNELSYSSPQGTSGRSILHASALYPDESPVFRTSDIVSWVSGDDDWAQSGDIYFFSATDILDSVNWNSTGSLTYGQQQYFATFNESNFDAPPGICNVAGKARGMYFLNGMNFWATIQESSLLVDSSYFGSVLGNLYVDISSAAESATFSVAGKVYDDEYAPYALTQNVLQWGPNDTSSWLSSGKVVALSYFTSVDSASGMLPSWEALLNFNYGHEQFLGVISEKDYAFSNASFIPTVSLTSGSVYSGHVQQQDLFLMTSQLAKDTLLTIDTANIVLSNFASNDSNENNTLHEYNFMTLAMGTYFGESYFDWNGQLTAGTLVYMHDILGYATGLVNFDVSSSGESADMAVQLQVVDGTLVPQVFTLQTVSWNSPIAYNWLEAGHLQLLSNMYLNPSLAESNDDYYQSSYVPPSWNASFLFQYYDHQFVVRALERDYEFAPTSYAPETNQFLVEGMGMYGGNWQQWQAALQESSLVVAKEVVGHAKGYASYSALNSVDQVNGTAIFIVEVVDALFQPVVNTSENLMWMTESDWLDSGMIYFDAALTVQNNFFVNGTISLVYEDNSYSVTGNEFQCFSGPSCFSSNSNGSLSAELDNWAALAFGTYHGTTSDWTVTLTRGQVNHNNDLLGYSVGNIHGNSPSDNWDLDGILNYQTVTRNNADALVLQTDGSFAYNPKFKVDGGFGSSGQVILESKVNMPVSSVNWNVSGDFWYGRQQYSLLVTEMDYSTDAWDSETMYNMLLLAEGGYGANSVSQAWMSVTNSLFEVGNVTYASIRAYLASDIPFLSNPTEGEIIVKGAYYYGTSDIGPVYPAQVYPSQNGHTVFWTDNDLSWKGDADLGYGFLLMNTSIVETPLFSVRSEFNASFVETNAYFMLEQTMNNIDGVDMWARADYDMESGMMANMGGEFYYENKLYFGANTAYDLQLKTIDNPNFSFPPTYSPTQSPIVSSASPTNFPVWAPSLTPSFAPSVMASVVPTLAPTDSQLPTLSPSELPTVSPSLAPSLVPGQTFSPTYQLTLSPSVAPTPTPSASPTITTSPTVSPTAVPTREPTWSPTAIPTASPTSAVATQMGVSQTISGLNATLVNSDPSYGIALKTAISACMNGVSANDIVNLVVSNSPVVVSTTGKYLRNAQLIIQATSGIAALVSYEVFIANPDIQLSYSSLSQQLTANVENGVFNQYLNIYSVQYNAPGLANCTSSAVSSENLSPATTTNNSKLLSTGAIVGIAIGGTAGLILITSLVYVVYQYCLADNAASTSAKHTSDSAVGEAVPDSSMKSSVPSAPAVPSSTSEHQSGRIKSTGSISSTSPRNRSIPSALSSSPPRPDMMDNPMRSSSVSSKRQSSIEDQSQTQSKTLPKKNIRREEDESSNL